MGILVAVAGTLAALAGGVQRTYEYCEGYGEATQHARIALERIAKTVREATANEQFPGFLVLAEQIGVWRFPDVLVVWHPPGTAANPSGLPCYRELVIYAPDWYNPNLLVELTTPDDARTVPPVSDATAWQQEIEAIRRSATVRSVVLTSLLRTAVVSESGGDARRGAVRFESRLRPTQAEWAEFRAGTRTWEQLAWAQSVRGHRTGLRQAWMRVEIQLLPGANWVANESGTQQPIPFFGSAALYYELQR